MRADFAALENPLQPHRKVRLWPCCKHCPSGVRDPHQPLDKPTHLDPCVWCGHNERDAVEDSEEEI